MPKVELCIRGIIIIKKGPRIKSSVVRVHLCVKCILLVIRSHDAKKTGDVASSFDDGFRNYSKKRDTTSLVSSFVPFNTTKMMTNHWRRGGQKTRPSRFFSTRGGRSGAGFPNESGDGDHLLLRPCTEGRLIN